MTTSIEHVMTAVRDILLNADAVTEILGNKVFSHMAPQGAEYNLPYITYSMIDDVPEQHLLGTANLSYTRIQVDCWSTRYAEVNRLADKTREALTGFSGVQGGIKIQRVAIESSTARFEKPESGKGVGIYNVSMDFTIGSNGI